MMAEPTDGRTSPEPQLPGLIFPALQAGAVSGTAGLLVGGTAGLVRSTSPGLFAVASGIQWFALGSTFWGIRGLVLQSRSMGTITPSDRVFASTAAGALAGGGIAAITRGRSNVIPATIMFSLFGYAGQKVYNSLDAKHSGEAAQQQPQMKSLLQRIGGSRWSPMTVLSDEDYEKMLQERLLRINAEIAIIDENIEKLRQQTPSTSEKST